MSQEDAINWNGLFLHGRLDDKGLLSIEQVEVNEMQIENLRGDIIRK